jgi:hypothetical protein
VQSISESEVEKLGEDLALLAGLLTKYGQSPQAAVVIEILGTLRTSTPDYTRLAGADMWGGSGAVWEVSPGSSRGSSEERGDRKSFHQTIVRIAATMDRMKIGNEGSRSVARIFREWMDKGTV